MGQEIANFFINEARRNSHRAANQLAEDRLLIYNWVPAFTGKHSYEGEEKDFEQAYFFANIGPDLEQPKRK